MRYVKQCIVWLPNVYLALNRWGILIEVLVALPSLSPYMNFYILWIYSLLQAPMNKLLSRFI